LLNDEAKELVDRVVQLYNEYAHRLNFRPYITRSTKVDRRIHARVEDIGGFENFSRALSVIHSHDFYMGRVPPKPGKKPFRLHIDFLLSQDGGCGDVLAGLVDLALDAGPNGQGVDASVDTAVQNLARSKPGKLKIAELGYEKGMEALRRIVEQQAKGAAA